MYIRVVSNYWKWNRPIFCETHLGSLDSSGEANFFTYGRLRGEEIFGVKISAGWRNLAERRGRKLTLFFDTCQPPLCGPLFLTDTWCSARNFYPIKYYKLRATKCRRPFGGNYAGWATTSYANFYSKNGTFSVKSHISPKMGSGGELAIVGELAFHKIGKCHKLVGGVTF